MRSPVYRSIIALLALAIAFAAPATTAAQTAVISYAFPVADAVDADPAVDICQEPASSCSLRAAVMEANARPGPDVIHLAPGTYTLSIPNASASGENASLTGDLDVTGDLALIGGGGDPEANPALTVIQAGLLPADGLGIDKVISFNPNFDQPAANGLAALTIRGGYNRSARTGAGDRAGDGWGGGMDWDASGPDGSLEITNCVFDSNTATLADGGALALWSSVPAAGPFGGTVTIARTRFTGNRALSGAGGAIFIGPYLKVTISASTVEGNSALVHPFGGSGGGIFQAPSLPNLPLTIEGSTISGNTALGSAASGGGAYLGGTAEIRNSTISGNQSGAGGGGSALGGGLAVNGASGELVTLRGVTITNNRVHNPTATGGGLWISPSPQGRVLAYNNLIVGNFTGAGTAIDNLSGALQPASASNLTSGNAGHLFPLADNGGPTLTHALRTGSPALDAGSNAQAYGLTDQRGQPRLADSADPGITQTVDLGAYEAGLTIQDVTDKMMLQDSALSVEVLFGDAALTPDPDLSVEFSNPALFPGVTLPSAPLGSPFTLHFEPAAGQSGVSEVTVTLTDPATSATASDTFTITVVEHWSVYLPAILK